MADETRRIEEGIGRTRAELGRTLDALAGRLSKRHLVEKGINMISNSIDGESRSRLGGEGRHLDPIPLALIGLGVAWLVASYTGAAQKIAEDERIRALPRRLVDLTGRRATADGADARGLRVVGGAGSDGGDAAGGGWVHQAADAARNALGSVRGSGTAALDRARSYAGPAGERAGDFAGQVSETFRRYPLLFGAAGIAAGAAAARLLPGTREEEVWLGPAREAAWDKAEDLGRETADRLRNAVGPEAGAAADSRAER